MEYANIWIPQSTTLANNTIIFDIVNGYFIKHFRNYDILCTSWKTITFVNFFKKGWIFIAILDYINLL